MRVSKLIKILLILVCIVIYGYSAINISPGKIHNISIDMSAPVSILWPFEVAVVGNEGEKGLRIGPKIGRGWCGEAGGEATYKFYIPADGTYHFWVYALWFDVCTNAIFAKIDDIEKAIIGNDPVYSQWHWVRGFSTNLQKGTHTLVLSNHSDHISLQKVLLTNSDLAAPKDCGPVFSDIFYDGFDGCDSGNFASWHVISGQWKVSHPAEVACLTENVLTGKSRDTALIILENKYWADYLLKVSVRTPVSDYPKASVGICFGLRDKTQYYKLSWHCLRKKNLARMYLVRKDGTQSSTLKAFEVQWDPDSWHEIVIALDENCIQVKIDDEKHVACPVNEKLTGGIGFYLEGEITAHFDDVHIGQRSRIQ